MSTNEPSTAEIRITVIMGALAAPVYRNYVYSLGLHGDERVLDFGCGSANPARYLARILQKGGRLTCLDISRRWLEVAQRRLRRYNNVEFRLGDIRTLEVPDAAYDAVFVHFVLHEIPPAERPAVVGALAGRLKPGGRLFLREPLQFIPRDEVTRLLRDAGLQETRGAQANIFSQGPVYEAVFLA